MANIKISNLAIKSNHESFFNNSYELEKDIQNKVFGGGTIDIKNETCTDCNRKELRTYRRLMELKIKSIK